MVLASGDAESHRPRRLTPDAKTFTVQCSQTVPKTPGQDNKIPMLCPIAIGLVGPDGEDMELTLDGESHGKTAVLGLIEPKPRTRLRA